MVKVALSETFKILFFNAHTYYFLMLIRSTVIVDNRDLFKNIIKFNCTVTISKFIGQNIFFGDVKLFNILRSD